MDSDDRAQPGIQIPSENDELVIVVILHREQIHHVTSISPGHSVWGWACTLCHKICLRRPGGAKLLQVKACKRDERCNQSLTAETFAFWTCCSTMEICRPPRSPSDWA